MSLHTRISDILHGLIGETHLLDASTQASRRHAGHPTVFWDTPPPENEYDQRMPIFDVDLKKALDTVRNNVERAVMAQKYATYAADLAQTASISAIAKAHQLAHEALHAKRREHHENVDEVAAMEAVETERCIATGLCNPSAAIQQEVDELTMRNEICEDLLRNQERYQSSHRDKEIELTKRSIADLERNSKEEVEKGTDPLIYRNLKQRLTDQEARAKNDSKIARFFGTEAAAAGCSMESFEDMDYGDGLDGILESLADVNARINRGTAADEDSDVIDL